MTEKTDNMKRLDREQCYRYFRELGTPPHVILHCMAVSNTAARIAEELNRNGLHLDVELIRYAGLAHDMARLSEDHEKAAAERLRADGYEEEADIVGCHMRHPFNPIEEICETDLVCLGDRVVEEHEYVGIIRRLEGLVQKRKDSSKHVKDLERAKQVSLEYVQQIEALMGCSMDSLFPKTPEQLLRQVEKPARYTGGECNMVRKDPADVQVRFAFAFPDMYEIGMSYMGLQIIYHILNQQEDIYCERVFAPAPDMEDLMRLHGHPLFTLETGSPLTEMDAVGFTLQYEMSFTNVLNMLELAGMPLLARERADDMPLIMAGGPCAYNPEPLADFIDVFLVGDGEEVLPAVLRKVGEGRRGGLTHKEILRSIAGMEGVYVPSFYEPVYCEDGTIAEYRILEECAPERVPRALVHDIEAVPYPTENLVPLIETVHDRAVVETFRGCTRGCRFCQAGMIYRPVRERSKDTILRLAAEQIANTGHDELSILSLSTSDYSRFEDLTMELMQYCQKHNVALSLPSLRLDTFSFRVLEEIQKYKKSGLTFAPEAGTQRLRDIINKGITEEDIYSACEQAIELGWRHVKLYFMIGLPGETDEDLDGIAEIARNIIRIHKRSGKGGRFNVTVSVSNFVPKAHTPFQWAPQDSTEEFHRKHEYLTERLKIKNVSFQYHQSSVSTCEAILARGDRRLGDLLLKAHEAGCKFDAWSEYYDHEKWDQLLADWPIDYHFYTERARSYEEILPWHVIDSGITDQFLMRENEKAKQGVVTPDCRRGCAGCGMNRRTTCAMGGIYV